MSEAEVPGFSGGGREPRFDRDAEIGYQGELWLHNIARAITEGYAEVKTDERAANTGNVFFEYQCLLKDGWTPSGIAATESSVWVHVIARRIGLVLPADLLRPVCRVARDEGRTAKGGTDGGNPTRGVLLPIPTLIARLTAEARAREAA